MAMLHLRGATRRIATRYGRQRKPAIAKCQNKLEGISGEWGRAPQTSRKKHRGRRYTNRLQPAAGQHQPAEKSSQRLARQEARPRRRSHRYSAYRRTTYVTYLARTRQTKGVVVGEYKNRPRERAPRAPPRGRAPRRAARGTPHKLGYDDAARLHRRFNRSL